MIQHVESRYPRAKIRELVERPNVDWGGRRVVGLEEAEEGLRRFGGGD
jgi:hypothetical protein